jgi:hypothetical protein
VKGKGFGKNKNRKRRLLTRNVLKLEECLKTSSVKLLVGLEDDAKEFMVGRDDVGFLDSTVTSHLSIDGFKVGELKVI